MRKLVILFLITLLVTTGYFYVNSADTSSSSVIEISSGQLTGVIDNDTGIVSFKGVPYAAPPIANNRWAPPKPARPWSGVLHADAHGPACVQTVGGEAGFIGLMTDGVGVEGWRKWMITTVTRLSPALKVSEDCLTLSVYAPANPSKPLPVMVWYHGGSHKFGAGDAPNYDGSPLAAKGVIVVSINYRLGIMGFFAHPELTAESEFNSSGNYGTLDQIHALEWVKENIESFGGDPENVTIFGESAGAHSVGQVLTSPLSYGLVDRAIAQSGMGTHQFTSLSHSREGWKSGHEMGLAFAESLGVVGEEQLPRLRKISAQQLVDSFDNHRDLDGLSHPIVDGWVLAKSTAATIAAGEHPRIPLIVGTNADEGTLLAPLIGTPIVSHYPGPSNKEEYEEIIRSAFPDNADDILVFYPVASDEALADGVNTLFGDHFFGMQAWFTVNETSRRGTPTWLYFFTRESPSPSQWAGAYHAADVQFVFNNFMPLFPKNDFDDRLAEQMMTYWTNFAKNGNPNGEGLAEWSAFNALDPKEMEFGESVGMRPVERREKYETLVIDQFRELGNDPSVIRSMGL